MINNDLYKCFRAWVSSQMASYDASHDIIHIDNVVHHVKKILFNENIDETSSIYEACIISALGHDVCDKKYIRNPKSKIVSMTNTLERLGASQNIVNITRNVVPRISFSKRSRDGEPYDLTENELFVYRVVSDADMLEALGATGVVRTYMFQAVHGHTARGAWLHTTNTLFRCINYLYFDYSKKEGEIRLDKMKRICSELEEERVFM